jgi:NhaA family Na+:H+ antiporter
MNWQHVAGVGMIGGVGFTVALFINELAFDRAGLVDDGKMGILAGSLVSAVVGFVVLRWATQPVSETR